MIFTIIIKHNLLGINHSALRFVQTALKKGYQIQCVYFLLEGVHASYNHTNIPVGEANFTLEWQKLATEHSVNLIICSSSGLRRGITQENKSSHFKIGSLGHLIAACDASDRTITF